MAQTNADYYHTVLQGQYEQQLQEVIEISGKFELLQRQGGSAGKFNHWQCSKEF